MIKEYFKISEIAKLTGVTRQTLIYYDKENILKPALVNEKKYRLYTIDQIHQLQIINMLKEFGTPLKTIREYLNNKDADSLIELLDEVKMSMIASIEKTQNYIYTINFRKNQIDKSKSITNYEAVTLKNHASIPIYRGKRIPDEQQRGHGHFSKIYDFERQLKKLDIIGFGLNVIVEQQFLKENYEDNISYFFVILNEEKSNLNNATIPGGLYVSTFHKGSNQTSGIAYKRLIKYIEENNLEISGDAYETIIYGFLTEKSSENYLSEIFIKVKDKK
ncbi:MAG: MerR family transcriptional regulator [Firmicutes bacterium]|jgi:DNA-binding transcriptional MerR regulator/effector-binding domain-containing protein|nr:MerR family transcriptional regulator [Bacillota bacterium]